MARTLASNRSRALARTDSLTMTPTRRRDERRDPHERVAAEARHSRALVDPGGVDDVRRDLDARDEIAARHDLAVEGGEDLERVDPVEPLEVGDPDVEDARGLGQEVHPALRRAALDRRLGPATAAASRSAASSSWSSPGSMTMTLNGSPGSAAGERGQVVGAQPAALDPAGGRRSAGRARGRRRPAGPGARRPGVTRWTCTPMAGWRSVAS